jgi:hypothetical protein
LIETEADVDGLRTAIDLDAGFALLEPEPQLETEPETEPATAEELDPEDDAPPEVGTTPETDR